VEKEETLDCLDTMDQLETVELLDPGVFVGLEV